MVGRTDWVRPLGGSPAVCPPQGVRAYPHRMDLQNAAASAWSFVTGWPWAVIVPTAAALWGVALTNRGNRQSARQHIEAMNIHHQAERRRHAERFMARLEFRTQHMPGNDYSEHFMPFVPDGPHEADVAEVVFYNESTAPMTEVVAHLPHSLGSEGVSTHPVRVQQVDPGKRREWVATSSSLTHQPVMVRVQFTDVNGVRWERSTAGVLAEVQ